MPRKLSSLLCLAVGILPLSGCSWAFMKRSPDPVYAPSYPIHCTTSRAAPVLDSVCGGYFAVNAAMIAAAQSCDTASPGEECIDSDDKAPAALLSAGIGALCLASAVSGFRGASSCDRTKGLNAACMTGDGEACRALRPDWRPREPVELPPVQLPGAAR